MNTKEEIQYGRILETDSEYMQGKGIWFMCNECCNKDGCDTPSHYLRSECPYCLGTGINKAAKELNAYHASKTAKPNMLPDFIKKYKTYVDNIKWHIKTNKPEGQFLKDWELKYDCYTEIVRDLLRFQELFTSKTPHGKTEVLGNQKLEDGYYWTLNKVEGAEWVILFLCESKWNHGLLEVVKPDIIGAKIPSPAETTPSLPYVGWVEIPCSERLPEFGCNSEGWISDEYSIEVTAFDCEGESYWGYFHLPVNKFYYRRIPGEEEGCAINVMVSWLEKTQYPAPSMVRDREIAGKAFDAGIQSASQTVGTSFLVLSGATSENKQEYLNTNFPG